MAWEYSRCQSLAAQSLYQRAENNLILTEPVKRINGVAVCPLLIGDSAYPSLPWLVSPYPHSRNLNRNQAKFNKILSKSRVIMERAFGKLKCRWRCLLKQIEENTGKVPHTILTVVFYITYAFYGAMNSKMTIVPMKKMMTMTTTMTRLHSGRDKLCGKF